ncbi:MAG TPA: DUF1579 family protein, partial [Chitinophagaceae bacterium]|nr:DUF1579 family protein [Chitinophagaceae bacterium]
MKRILIAAFAGAFLIACNNEKKDEKTADATKETTMETKTDKAWVPIDSAMMMKVWQENMTISENHKMMAKGNGTWTGEATMWMANGAPPTTSTVTAVTESIYGGLYSQSKQSGDMMGSPFQGVSTMGYDNLKKEFFSTWIDNMGSGVITMTGQYDDAAKKLNLSGKAMCM